MLLAKDYRAIDFHLQGMKVQGLYRTEMGLWFSSDKGLYLYDGHEALPVVLPPTPGYKIESAIIDIYPASDDALFLLVRNIGFCYYNFRENTIDIYGFFEEQASPLYGNTITAFHRLSEHKVMLGLYRRGLDILDLSTGCVEHFDFVLDPENAMQTLNLNHITDIKPDPFSTDVFWLSCSRGLMRFNMKTRECSEHIYGYLDEFPQSRSVINLHLDEKEGILWFGTWGNGLMKLDLRTGERQAFLSKKIEKLSGFYNVILDLVTMDEDRFWICSNDLGISFFDKKNESFTVLANNPFHEKVDKVLTPRKMHKDLEGNLWVVFDDRLGFLSAKPEALSKIDLSAHNHAQSINFQIYGALLKGDDQYFLTFRGDGVLKAERDSFVYLGRSDKVKSIIDSELVRFHIKGDSTFVFGSSGLYYLDEKADMLRSLHKHPEGMGYRRSFFDGNRYFYFGSRWNGFYQYDLYNEELKNIDIASSYDASYTSDFEMDDKGRLWISHDAGISHYFPSKDSVVNYDISSILEESSSTQRISFLNRTADNKMLFGSYEGLFAFAHPDSIPFGAFHRLDSLLNKGDRFVRDLYQNERGEYWVLTDNRLLLFDENWLSLAVMDKGDGLEADFRHYRICPLNQDSLLLTGPHTAFFVSRSKLLQEKTSPVPRLRSVMLMNSLLYDVTVSDRVNALEFDYDQNFIDLEIVPMSFSAVEKSRLQWRMKGLQDEWRSAYGPQRLSYNSIGPGQYYFQFQTIDQRGKVLSPIRELSLLIRPPYWETWWFRILVFIAVVLFVFSIYRIRLKQIRDKDKIRADFEKALVEVELKALRAQMNPHFIFNSLNSIKHFLIKSDIQKGVLYLNKFSRLLRMILNHSQHNQVSLEEELNFLRLYLKLEQMRFEQSFEWRIEEPKDLDLSKYAIPTLSIQPLVENAIWHGLLQKRGHRKLIISLKAEEDRFEISILDNGIGREAAGRLRSRSSLKHKSMGLDMVKNRLSLFTGGTEEDYIVIKDLRTDSGMSAGTEVLISLPKLSI